MGPFDIDRDAAELEAKPGAKRDARLDARQFDISPEAPIRRGVGEARGVGKVSSWKVVG